MVTPANSVFQPSETGLATVEQQLLATIPIQLRDHGADVDTVLAELSVR